MIILKEPLAIFDCDDTLVSWHYSEHKTQNSIAFTDPTTQEIFFLEEIKVHTQALKNHKLRGHTIVVWSASGAAWAEEVVTRLGLTGYVDACMTKPNWAYDDLPASEFIPESIRKYLVK